MYYRKLWLVNWILLYFVQRVVVVVVGVYGVISICRLLLAGWLVMIFQAIVGF